MIATLALFGDSYSRAFEPLGPADRMMADSVVIAYYKMLRLQGWIGSRCLTVERELFGQAPLSEIHGPTAGNQLAGEFYLDGTHPAGKTLLERKGAQADPP